jgi:serine/threonine-protein kinase
MPSQGVLLQNRYRILRQIGGGGMGVVYLAEDNRLASRRCAIKEMSPAQLAPQDRAWAIPAFQREAQILARLSHPGLTAVTDFFPEGGNWYLVMDYVEGETLKDRLARAPGGRMPLDEALNITRQLCNVLGYLHGQSPPVVFRDLKPGNVMITRRGELKLIDFGIARFFKRGQSQDTVNLGTPGYAAPEQYGGRGQSDPRADVYSLGALLLQMATGYDPAAADTPFPLPAPGDLMRGLPAHVEEVISCATRVQPALRYPSVDEMRQALFPPTWVLPQPPPPAPSPTKGRWIALGGAGAAVLVGLCIIGLLVGPAVWSRVQGVVPPLFQQEPSAQTPTVATHTPTPTVALSGSPSPTSLGGVTPSSSATATPMLSSQPVEMEWVSMGQSVRGRDLSVARIGYEGGTAVVVVGSIQGDQTNTKDLVEALIHYFDQNPQQVSASTAFYFVPSLNPDGSASKSRYNARGVDLNRNWDTKDWLRDAAVPGYPGGKPGAGGSRPFSEPETWALRDFLLPLQARAPGLSVVVLHSSVHRSRGELYPGGSAAVGITSAYASATGYEIETKWAEYTTSGELVTWCDENGILAIDVVIPGSHTPSTRVSGSRTLLDITVQGLLTIADYH